MEGGGVFDSVGGFFEGILTAGSNFLSERNLTERTIAQQNAAVQAATAASAFDFKKYQLMALALIGGGVLIYALKRG